MTERVKCKRCGASILPETSKRFGGCCAHCGRVPWLFYYGVVAFVKFVEWIGPVIDRVRGIPAPDKTLFLDLARLVEFPPKSIAALQNKPAEKMEDYFLEVLERKNLG